MKFNSYLLLTAALLLGGSLLATPTAQAFGPSMKVVLLGEPDVFVPGFGLETEIALTRFLGIWAAGAYFISGTWDLETGLRWHLSQQFALSLQALFCSTW